LILGSGPAGLTAAIYAARGGLEPLVIAGSLAGGQLMTTTEVDNYPGFPQGIHGPDLIENMRQQAERFKTVFIARDATEVDFTTRPFRVVAEGEEFHGQAVIIATGATPRWLGLPAEQRLRGSGVSTCATCDGAFFRKKDVCVVGGGDTAVGEAIYLSNLCRQVTLLHRGTRLRATHHLVERMNALPNVDARLATSVVDVLGGNVVEGVRVSGPGGEETLPCAGLFVAIGHRPNTEFLRGQVELDERGYVVSHERTHTSVKGVFVAGDVYDVEYQQAVTAAASGCRAAIDAARYLEVELPLESY
jgi:thioredoxin reductase (NADPH)